jgi:competence ComEA-like helix-hairpin-helix protein
MEIDIKRRIEIRNFLVLGLSVVAFLAAVFHGEISLQLESSFPRIIKEFCALYEKETPLGGKEIECLTPHLKEIQSPHLLSGQTSLILGIPIDINTASTSDLEALPGIGPRLANNIIEYRHKIGYFKSTGQLLGVKGIGTGKLRTIQNKIIIHEEGVQ